MSQEQKRRLLVVSNRLPAVVERRGEEWQITPGSGGLVTALAPVMRQQQGLWIGWPGCGDEAPLGPLLAQFTQDNGYSLAAVPLSADEVEKYYRGFSNEALWPLFHDLLGFCRFSYDNWQVYLDVNRRFAQVVTEHAKADDLIWVHDYQLIGVGEHLRALQMPQPLGYFLHIPFPAPDLFRRLPWKDQLIRALLAYDLLGFQTLRDRRNFVNTASSLLPEIEVISRKRQYDLLRFEGRTVRVGHFPISIDFDEFDSGARSKEVEDAAWYLHENLHGRQLMLGVDRLDYTKGIPERFLAFERALEKYPELITKISLMQLVVPSRTLVPDYQNLKETLDQLAGRINARFGESMWNPIYYVFRSLDRTQLLARYRTSEIALVTPLRDGMNLVAKEYCASSVENNGVLILSEFTGAADQLGKGALLVNPYDIEGTADAIHQAYVMGPDERRRRMKLLRNEIRRNDVHRWLNSFTQALYSS
ncbi:MAG: trehalose-6-phosphate synthase [Desulfuromonadales bacterium C00003094]|jgi:trehalose 6-phosphate synthase|nr:MAG: trehalose-6-phosphate synthase [Desulfuromonadales bacterium C00003094]